MAIGVRLAYLGRIRTGAGGIGGFRRIRDHTCASAAFVRGLPTALLSAMRYFG